MLYILILLYLPMYFIYLMYLIYFVKNITKKGGLRPQPFAAKERFYILDETSINQANSVDRSTGNNHQRVQGKQHAKPGAVVQVLLS